MTNKNSLSANTTINLIPIRNIWLLLLYASEYYQVINEQQRNEFEQNPEEIVELAAQIYCYEVNKRLYRPLSTGYQPTKQILNRVRGKIDNLTTARKQLLEKGKIQCLYDDLTIDTPKNRYIHAAGYVLLNQLTDNDLRAECKKITKRFQQLNIGKSNYYNYLADRFDRSNLQDHALISLTNLIFQLLIPTEIIDINSVTQLEKTDQWLRFLFEKAIIGFYRVNLDPKQWKINSGKQMKWHYSQSTANIKNFLPDMKTDLIIEHNDGNYRLIIDTKCTSIFKKSNNSFNTHHLYQLYAYLRSQEQSNDPLSFSASGMLLYPTVKKTINEHLIIQGHKLTFCTIDLTQDNKTIKADLLALLSDYNPA